MDTDSLFLIFGYLKIRDKIVFGLVCSRWRFVYSSWLDLPLAVLLILYQRKDLKLDDIAIFGLISKKHQKVMNHLLRLNKTVKSKWISTHKKLCKNPNKQTPNDQPKQLCNLISDLGIGVLIDSAQQSIQLISVWGEELTFPIPTDFRYLYSDCLFHHHMVEKNQLTFHSLRRNNDDVVTFVVDCSNMKNIVISWEQLHCCNDMFFKHHYYSNKDLTIVANYKQPYITCRINQNENIYTIPTDVRLLSFAGPYFVSFTPLTIELYDMVNNFRKLNSSDQFFVQNCEPLFLKYYPQCDTIYVFCKRERSFQLTLNTKNWTFTIVDVGELNFIENFYEHNQHTNNLEIIPKHNCSEQFTYNSQMDNFSFFAAPQR
jgi:hypothetical protein